eukprot:1875939-Prymnesium_polylepis.1
MHALGMYPGMCQSQSSTAGADVGQSELHVSLRECVAGQSWAGERVCRGAARARRVHAHRHVWRLLLWR